MNTTICLSQAVPSPTRSQAFCGFTDSGVYLTTPEVFWVADKLYKALDGTFYCIESWGHDGSGYKDKKEAK